MNVSRIQRLTEKKGDFAVNKKMPAWAVLTVVCLCAGILLAVVNIATAGRIKEQEILTRNATRSALFPAAVSFEELEVQESDYKIDSIVSGLDADGQVLGYVGQTTVKGYGGPVEIVAAVDNNGIIQGISVGGNKFAETPGLGALAKEPEFTDQFIGKIPTLVLNQDGVDTIAGASTTSKAIVRGVNAIANYIYAFELGLTEEEATGTEPAADAASSGASHLLQERPKSSDAFPLAPAYLLITSPTQTGWLPLPEEGAYSYHLKQVFEDQSEAENVIHLTPEGVCMESSTCPNQDCIQQGMVSLENRSERLLSNMIICLPNQVSLELYSREEAFAMLGLVP